MRKLLRGKDSGRFGKPTGIFEQLETKCLLAADVYISEFMASNEVLLDEDGDDPDWLEVYNAGPDSVNLSSWYLTDDAAELKKWSFPSHELSAGESVVVFASSKDRADPGAPLHTNFRLSAGGEYLALSKPLENDAVEVVSEFAPEFPAQVTDVSYGFTQTVDTTEFVTRGSDAKILVATEEVSSSWRDLSFDDSNWSDGVASAGYQQTVPGFTVQQVNDIFFGFENLSEATELFEGTGRYSDPESRIVGDPIVVPNINFQDADGGGSRGRFRNDNQPFPGDNIYEIVFTPEEIAALIEQGVQPEQFTDDNFFVVRGSGTIDIPDSGLWTFHTHTDDGFQLWIDGESVIREDTLTFGSPSEVFGAVELEAGSHTIEFQYFEYAFGASLELSAAFGEFDRFSRSEFLLIGDVESGGLPVRTSPDGGDARIASYVTTDLHTPMANAASSAYLRIPFDVEDPTELESLALNMRYDDGFVAYLNGQEIARDNAPEQLTFDAVAIADRRAAEAAESQTFDISDSIPLLQPGSNLLAIHGLNDATDSPEFLISAEVVQTVVTRSDSPVYFRDATPGEANTTAGTLGFLMNDVSTTVPHGFYDAAFETQLVAQQGTTIRYTTDGTIPTEDNGMTYDGPITIDRTTTLRARSFADDLEPSETVTVTYLFLDDVITQGARPEGWPSNSNGQTMNYGMDTDITQDEVWGPQLREALTQIPSMSVVMDQDDFVGSERGIYSNARSHGRDWERPASLELINPDGSQGFQHDMGIRVRGGFSRTSSNPKHAFRLFFRDAYGDGNLEFPLFGDEGAEYFEKIDLRTSQNYSWAFRGDGRNNFVRDVFSRDVQGQMGQPYTRSRFYHLYINGQYWGLFQTQERAEARFAASYFGGDSDDYDVVKSAGSVGGYANEATDGDMDAYLRLWNFFQGGGIGDDNLAGYWQAQGMNPDGTRNPEFERLLDVDNLIDYMIITYYTADADGPGSRFTRPRVNNYFAIYNRENPDGFKFFEHDSEHSLDTGNAAGANFNLVEPLLGDFVGSNPDWFNPHWMHEQLANSNTVYRERFQDAVYRHLFNDGPLTAENADATLARRAEQIDMAIIAESARWGDAQRTTPYTKENWESAVETSRNWVASRVPTVVSQLQNVGWYPEDANPPQFIVANNPQHGGAVLPSDEIDFLSSDVLDFETILPTGSVWHYEDSGNDLGNTWREPAFDDTTWNSGPGKLAYGETDAATELNSEASPRPTTVYFRSTFTVDDPSQYAGGLVNVLRDDGAVVYINGQEIGRSNMPLGDVTYDTLAVRNNARDENVYFPLDFAAGVLQPGENTIAVEVHQFRVTASGDLAFDLELQLGTANFERATIYYTTDGTDPKQANGEPSDNALTYLGEGFQLAESTEINVRVLKEGQWSIASRANFELIDALLGDLNQDGTIDALDIDALAAAIRSNSTDTRFDLNEDEVIDGADYQMLLDDVLGARRADVDLNGTVDYADFLVLSKNFGKNDATWSEGDANGDGNVSFEDFLLLSGNFGLPSEGDN